MSLWNLIMKLIIAQTTLATVKRVPALKEIINKTFNTTKIEGGEVAITPTKRTAKEFSIIAAGIKSIVNTVKGIGKDLDAIDQEYKAKKEKKHAKLRESLTYEERLELTLEDKGTLFFPKAGMIHSEKYDTAINIGDGISLRTFYEAHADLDVPYIKEIKEYLDL